MYFSFIILSLLICSTVPRSSVNPACASSIISLAVDFILANIKLNNTLLEWLMRLIVLLLLHFQVFPFFSNSIIIDSVHRSGHSPDSSIMLLMLRRMSTTCALLAFRSAAVILSVPGELLFFNFLIAAITSSFMIIGSLSY